MKNEQINSKKNQDEPASFEAALAELEEIMKKLESGNLSLDESINLYARGVALSHYCNNKLEEAQNKISLLVKDQKGEFHPQDFLQDPQNKKNGE